MESPTMAFSSINEELGEDMIGDAKTEKYNQIQDTLKNGSSLWKLREMALTRGGLVNGKYRITPSTACSGDLSIQYAHPPSLRF